MFSQNIRAPNLNDDSCLFIGQDRRGRWVVKDRRAVIGGLFADRTTAIRFAMYECQRHPQSVIMLPDGLELDAIFEDDISGVPAKALAA
jgi:hypothetical protein